MEKSPVLRLNNPSAWRVSERRHWLNVNRNPWFRHAYLACFESQAGRAAFVWDHVQPQNGWIGGGWAGERGVLSSGAAWLKARGGSAIQGPWERVYASELGAPLSWGSFSEAIDEGYRAQKFKEFGAWEIWEKSLSESILPPRSEARAEKAGQIPGLDWKDWLRDPAWLEWPGFRWFAEPALDRAIEAQAGDLAAVLPGALRSLTRGELEAMIRDPIFRRGVRKFSVAAYFEGKPIALGLARRDETGRAELLGVFVTEKFQNRGLGSRLMAEIIRRARAQRLPALRVRLSPLDRVSASKLASLGFTRAARLPVYRRELVES